MKRALHTILWIGFTIFLIFLFFICSIAFGTYETGSAFPKENYFAGTVAVLIILVPTMIRLRNNKKMQQRMSQNPENARALERSRVHMMDSDLALIDSGRLPNVFGTGIALKDGETAYFSSAADLITSTERVVGHRGRCGGVSVRVARGVTLHSGSSSGQPIYGRVEQTYKGSLIITSNRIVFLNPLKGFEVKTDKITAITPYSNGIGIQAGNKSYTLIVPYNDYAIRVLNMMRLY